MFYSERNALYAYQAVDMGKMEAGWLEVLSAMLNLKSVFGFLWLVWVGNQGKIQCCRHWPSPDSFGANCCRGWRDESSVVINGMAIACWSIQSQHENQNMKTTKVRWFKSAEKATYAWKANCYFKNAIPEDDLIHGRGGAFSHHSERHHF